MAVSIVTTTINKPVLLRDYCKSARAYGHTDVSFIVIGDQKTPGDVGLFCDRLTREYGCDVLYFDVDKQLDYLRKFPELAHHLPFNSIQRRNIGLLVAYEMGAEVIVSIDDDNLVTESDFVGRHAAVGSRGERECVASDSGWFNVCEMLVEEEGRPFYHRGFPMAQRWKKNTITTRRHQTRVVVNAGLWLNDPDIDAITRMDMPVRALALKPEYSDGVVLDMGTWCPFNSQNTALAREVVPAYFLSPYIGRYDDIWASYFLRRIIDHLGDAVQYGPPLVHQARNDHNLWTDLDKEHEGMELTDRLVDLLRDTTLTTRSYGECFGELIERTTEAVETNGVFKLSEKEYLLKALKGMRIWSGVFHRIQDGERPGR
ncbi:MAG: hypothetical protein ACE5JL_06595 [Dehalococcoidia bacterium]